MCNPAFIPLAIAGVQAIAGETAKKDLYDLNNFVADQDLEANEEAIGAQRVQINKQAADQMSERARQALIERGRLRAIAGDTGVSGVSQDRILRASEFDEGQDIAMLEANRASALEQNDRSLRAAKLGAQRTKLGLTPPSLVGAGLQIATASAKAYSATRGSSNAPVMQDYVPGQYSTGNPQYG